MINPRLTKDWPGSSGDPIDFIDFSQLPGEVQASNSQVRIGDANGAGFAEREGSILDFRFWILDWAGLLEHRGDDDARGWWLGRRGLPNDE
jgi:hypothetical protein